MTARDPTLEEFVAVARKLWGPETDKTPDELRFGKRGSKSIDLKKLVWFDHENNGGGGWTTLYSLAGEPLPNGTDTSWNHATIYDYCDERGDLLFQAVKYSNRPHHKRFTQRRPDGNGGWVWKLAGVRRVLYRLPELLAAPPDEMVFVCEGEKDADNVRRLGLVATSNPGGAGKWRAEYSDFLKGRHCAILVDNDDSGRAHAADVERRLKNIAASVMVIELPGLAAKGDVSDWIAAGGTAAELLGILALARAEAERERTKYRARAEANEYVKNGHGIAPLPFHLLTLQGWLERDLPPPDFLLGELLSTTTRAMLVGPTGLGKTMVGLALGLALTQGPGDFLHWKIPRQARGLYVDGEMSRRLMKRRIIDEVRRQAAATHAPLFILSREDFPDMPPLNTPEGQHFVDSAIVAVGGVDFVIVDNIQAWTLGDMKDELSWEETLPWVRDLTRREIGQLWIHHTGHDSSRSYGTKTREWQLDTVMHMEEVTKPDTDIAFNLTFPKARERTPDNRADFEPALITLAGDEWTSTRGGVSARPARAKDRVLEILEDTIARHGQVPDATEHIPPDTPCVTEDLWRAACEVGCISEGSQEANDRAFRRAAKALIESGRITKHKPWIWIVRPRPDWTERTTGQRTCL